jgi:phage shock protein A
MSDSSNFWQRPEGQFGKLVGVALLAALGFALWGTVVPFVLATVANTVWLGVYCGVAALVAWLILDGSLLALAANVYKRCIRALYILSFNVDPIGGLKDRIKELREKVAFARQKAAEVNGQAQTVKQTIEQNKAACKQGVARAEAAQRAGELDLYNAELQKAGFAEQANEQLLPLYERLDRMVVMLTDVTRKADIQVDVLQSAVMVKERSFKASKAGRSAMRAAMTALKNDGAGADMFQTNMDWIDEYVGNAIGEFDALLTQNSNALATVDLDSASWSNEAFKELERRQQKVQTLLTSAPAQKLLTAGAMGFDVTPTQLTPQAQPVASGDFTHLFGTDSSPRSTTTRKDA